MEEVTQQHRILIVDDDKAFLDDVSGFLREQGYLSEVCHDPHQTLAMIEKCNPEVVLLDISMPLLDGEDLLLLIRRRYPKLSVIICTGMPCADERYLLKSGAVEVLKKPFSPSALFQAIEEAFEKEERTPIVVSGFNLRKVRDTVLRKMVIKALSRTNFNVTQAASLLGVSRQCLLRYVKHLQITY